MPNCSVPAPLRALASAPSVLVLPLLAMPACVEVDDPGGAELASWRDGPGDVFPPPYAVPGQWTFDEPPCGVPPDPTGGGIPEQLGIDAPIPPQGYRPRECSAQALLDGDCVEVHDTAELEAAASSDPGKNLEIILDDGYYLGSGLSEDGDPDTHEYLVLGRAHRLWAKNPGAAILTFGVVSGGSPCNPATAAKFDGPEFHGLVFDITNPYYAFRGQQLAGSPTAALASWGHSRGMKVQDCWFRGWDAVDQAIWSTRPDGMVVERVEILNFERFGVRVALAWPAETEECPAGPPPVVVGDPARLSDLAIHGIGDPEWASQGTHPDCGSPMGAPLGAYCPGTQEHGIWIGDTTFLDRARVRDVAWSGVIVADDEEPVVRTTLRDVDVDDVGSNEDGWGAGIGFEHGNDGTTLEQFCVGPDVRRGVHSEWDVNTPGWENVNLAISDGWIRAELVGITLDSGTRGASIDDVRIENAWVAAMAQQQNNDIWPNSACCTTTTWTNIDVTGTDGCCEIAYDGFPNKTTAETAAAADDCTLLGSMLDHCSTLACGDHACQQDLSGHDVCPPAPQC